jgi:arylsulfatase A-like enzyme
VPGKNLICIVVDRLHAGTLGAYGNSWVRTGHFDHLAGESFLLDQAYIDSPQLDRLYRAYWHGIPTVARHRTPGESLPSLVRAGGSHAALVTDDPQVRALPQARDFGERLLVDVPAAEHSAGDVSESQMARLFTAVTQWLDSAPAPFFLWVHARGMAGDWDAPLALRNAYADEEDPTPPDFITVPNRRLMENYDPDLLLGIVHAYAGQVTQFDACLGALLDYLEESGLAATTQLTLLGARGFPLGEHLRVGACDDALYNELLQMPWLMRFPDGLGKLDRSQALARPSDLPGTLLEWLELDRSQLGTGAASLLPLVRGDEVAMRDRLCMLGPEDKAIRTQAWFLRRPASGPPELYAKPSDRWEVNEVSKLCTDVVEGLEQALDQIEQVDQESMLAPLADLLTTVVD